MVDLVVPAGTVLVVDPAFIVEPSYGTFRMGANATIVAQVDLVLKADRAEFAENCVIDARGQAGAFGVPGVLAGPGSRGHDGGSGGAGGSGHSVTIEAGLAVVGSLTVTADGGAGGQGGAGGPGVPFMGPLSASGGNGGPGGGGGPGGQVTVTWTRLAGGLPTSPDTPPPGHVYRGFGGLGGAGGAGGPNEPSGLDGMPGSPGQAGQPGQATPAHVIWRTDVAELLWAQAQDMGPTPRSGHGVAFDPGRGKLVLFGGMGADQKALGDTWEWDGRLWTQVEDIGPTPRAFHGMAWDPTSRRVLVFGGTGNPGAEAAGVGQTWLGDTWSWDGRIWIQLADTGPSARQAPAMAGDPVRSRVTLFSGGQLGQGRQAVADTWEWDGARWLEVADTGPSPRLAPSMAFDAGTNKLILFGGIGVEAGPAAAPSDTWAWDGHLWTQVADTGPSARLGHAMATVDSSIVLFGGQVARPDGASGVSLGDTWAWTAGVWRQTQDIGPGPRSSHAMDYVVADSSASITLFGGQGSGALQDTWRLVSRA